MSALEKARAAWPGAMPDWVEALAEACDRTSQSRVARQLDYSTTLISQVINRVYRSDLARVEQVVRGALMRATVDCPVVGELSLDRCQRHQSAPWSPHSPTRLAFWQACRGGCPHSRLTENGDDQI